MKKRVPSIYLLFLRAIVIVLVLTGAACKSAPAPAPAKTVTSARPTNEALRGSLSRAEEARRRAMDFEAPAYFPSDWDAAEAKYASAKSAFTSTESEVQAAIVLYNAAAETYDELFNKTIPLYAQAKEDEIMAAREEVIRSGLTAILPDYLKQADKIAVEALDQYEAKDYYKARDTAADALKEYQSLLLGAKVYSTRREIIERGFIEYDPENYEKAEDIAQLALDEYNGGNKEAAKTNAEEALLRYNIVLANGWTAYAAERRAAAIVEREYAIENKANIAVREFFREADSVFNQAESNYKAEKFDSAATQFTEAEARFVLASQETEGKRQKAMETIIQAEEKIEESVETAAEAERLIEGGSK